MDEIVIEYMNVELSLSDICERCQVDDQTVIRLVNLGVAEPQGGQYSEWRFSASGYLLIKKALRLQRDLALNDEGVALAIDLLERLQDANSEIEYLRQRLARWES
jgi:chaperone modulatory protein CbpM